MFGRPTSPAVIDQALLELVTDVVPPGSATIQQGWLKNPRGWFVQVTPHRPDACPFTVSWYKPDRLRFTVADGTDFDLYRIGRPRDLNEARPIIEALVGGRIVSEGAGRKSWVRIDTGVRLPMEFGTRPGWRPWRRVVRRQFVPYL